MKFELKGAVNYLPAATYGKMNNNHADIDFVYEVHNDAAPEIKSADGVRILSSGTEYEELAAKADFVKTGMEALNLDSKAGGDSLED